MTDIKVKGPKSYKYINRLDLKPGSDASGKIVNMVKERAGYAKSKMASRREVWRQLDSTLNAFVTPEDAAKLEQRNEIRNVVIPVNYAMLQTLLTYLVMMYNQSPMFTYGAYGGKLKDVVGAELLNLEIQRQVDKSSMLLNLHTQWRDAYVYGFGAVSPVWTVDTHKTYNTDTVAGVKYDNSKEKINYIGNKLYNINPYNILPDPNVPIEQVSESSFFGFVKTVNIYDLELEEAVDWKKGYVNVDYVKQRFGEHGHRSPYSAEYDAKESGNKRKYFVDPETQQKTVYNEYNSGKDNNPYSKSIDLVVMYMKINPKQLELGINDTPEWWSFVLCDNIILQAVPLNLNHGQVPVCIGAFDYDGYSTSPISRMEEVKGLQDTLNWNISSQVANVKKSLNDMFVVDPKFVNIHDLKSPKPGKIIRMRKAGFGTDVRSVFQQLQVQNMTGQNVNDMFMLKDMMHYITAAQQNASGSVMQRGERISASETNNAMRAALSRIDKDAVIFSKQAVDNLGYLLASQTIQFMDEPLWIRTNKENFKYLKTLYGDTAKENSYLDAVNYGYLQVSPELIDINFDVVCNDKNLTGLGDESQWITLYQILTQNPDLAKEFDLFKIFEHIARKMGAKNVQAFRKNVNGLNVNTQPTDQVREDIQKGNLVPVEGEQ